jgi:C4-dicarboxylate-specific signal transduction histidine kinase
MKWRTPSVRENAALDAVQTEITEHGRAVEFPPRILGPFFTSNGPGVGLAIFRRLIGAMGGRLSPEKNEPQGTTFVFALPVDVKAAP